MLHVLDFRVHNVAHEPDASATVIAVNARAWLSTLTC
jgi:hypothetical protein